MSALASVIAEAVWRAQREHMVRYNERPQFVILAGHKVYDELRMTVSTGWETPCWRNDYSGMEVLGHLVVCAEFDPCEWRVAHLTNEEGRVPPTDSRQRHVYDGFCPIISRTKMWCGKPVGHPGWHGSRRIPYPDAAISPTNPDWVDWDE